MQKLAKVIAVSLLGLAYTLATPVIPAGVFHDGISSGKAYADVRDRGHVKKDRKKDPN